MIWNGWRESLNDNSPIYQQIISLVKRGIVKGDIKPAERIASIRDMSGELRVNPNTVQRAFREMEREGIIHSQRGMGYFVTEDEEKIMGIKTDLARTSIARFLDEMRALGMSDEQILDELKRIIGEGSVNG